MVVITLDLEAAVGEGLQDARQGGRIKVLGKSVQDVLGELLALALVDALVLGVVALDGASRSPFKIGSRGAY